MCLSYLLKKKLLFHSTCVTKCFFPLARRSDGYLQRGLGHFCNDQRMPHKLLITLLVAFQRIKQFMLFVFL